LLQITPEQLPHCHDGGLNLPETAEELCLLKQFTPPKFKNSWSCCYKSHCTGFQRGTGKNKREKTSLTEQATLEPNRIFSLNSL